MLRVIAAALKFAFDVRVLTMEIPDSRLSGMEQMTTTWKCCLLLGNASPLSTSLTKIPEVAKHGLTGVHVENIFFPRGGGLIGFYTVQVKLPFSEARANDHWTVLVYVDGEQVYQNHGVGESAPLTYEYSRGSEGAIIEASDICSLDRDECCTDSDCKVTGSLCVQRSCISDGDPRFTNG